MAGRTYPIICCDCERLFHAKWPSTRRCDNCHRTAKTNRQKTVGKPRPLLEKACARCGSSFEAKSRLRKYCDTCKALLYPGGRYRGTRERLNAKTRKWRRANPDKVREYKRRDSEKHRLKRREYKKHYDRKTRQDPKVRLIHGVRARIATAIAHAIRKGISVGERGAMRFLGCPFPDFLAHLESQFREGMTWDNYGKDGWHVDHIYPVGKANLEDPAEKRAAFNWQNCRPVWAAENMEKNDTVTPEAEALFRRLVEEARSVRVPPRTVK